MPTPKHAPSRLASYISVHDTVMRQFRDRGFVGDDTLEFFDFQNSIFLSGQIGCLGQLVLSVNKILKVTQQRGERWVETTMYAYNASVSGHGTIFRYDNQHADSLHQDHGDPHHKHLFNWKTHDEEQNSPVWIGVNGWPTLGEVLSELRVWQSDHYQELPGADLFPTGLTAGIRF